MKLMLLASGFKPRTLELRVHDHCPSPWLDVSPFCRSKRLILIKMLVYEFLTQPLASKLVKAEDGMQHYAGQN